MYRRPAWLGTMDIGRIKVERRPASPDIAFEAVVLARPASAIGDSSLTG
jgi:hypothetical protein